ncbi:hypothetical protein FRB99_005740 [Tulasnella sp. 403]|nr:hypothetical protein FRB99_005740 [Tulasnella sp. 403]
MKNTTTDVDVASVIFQSSDPDREIPRLVNRIRENLPASSAAVAEGLRLGITEQPYKIPFYANLITSLYVECSRDSQSGKGLPISIRAVMEDFVKGFQTYLDGLKWLQLRLCAPATDEIQIHFFAHLVALRVVAAGSLLALLQSFVAVLDEPGVSYYRARSAALCAGEALLRCGSALYQRDPTGVNDIITALKVFSEGVNQSKMLASPIVKLHEKPEDLLESMAECREQVSSLVKALSRMQDTSFLSPPASLPRSCLSSPLPEPEAQSPGTLESPTFGLPFVLVPPDALDLEAEDGVSGAPGPVIEDGKPKQPTKLDVPTIHIRLFPDDVTPEDTTPAGYLVRTCMQDILDIFEINRKEAARLILDLPRWWDPATFKGQIEADGLGETERDMQWSLECIAVESTLSTAFVLPIPPHLPIYYYALITELCKLSPSTVGPAVGKSIRKLYRLLDDPATLDSGALDVEVAKRVVEWFAVHMSNFAFNWVWKEWIPDLSLSRHHPRRRFIQRAIELEIRASYYDRIKETLPVEYHDPEATALPEEAPGANYDYSSSHPLHDEAESLLTLVRNRSKADEVLNHSQQMCESLASRMSLADATTNHKVQKVKKEEEDAKAKLKASKGEVVDEGMDVDIAIQDDTSESPALSAALKALSTLTRDQKTALVRALDGFVSFLGSSSGAGSILSREAWHSREHWGQEEWNSWETWGWFRHFCRAYAPQLKTYINTLESVSLSKLDSTAGVDANAAAMVREVWNLALGGE